MDERAPRAVVFKQFLRTLRYTLKELPEDKMLLIYSPSEEAAKELLTRFREQYPEVAEWMHAYTIEGRKEDERWVTQLALRPSTESEST